MTNSKRRCTYCKGYFVPEEMLKAGIAGVCSTECLIGLQERARSKRARRKDHRLAAKKQNGRRIPGNVRMRVKRRDGQACRYCGIMSGRIELHHIKYRSQAGPDTDENLITLCQEHHALMHSNKRRWQPVLRALMHAYYEDDRFLRVTEAEKEYRRMLHEFPADPDSPSDDE